MNTNRKPIFAISMGDPNGIGPEITLKALARRDVQDLGTFIVFMPTKLWAFYKQKFKIKVNSISINSLNDIKRNKINIFSISDKEFKIEFGKSTTSGGALSLKSLQVATKSVKDGICDVLVTAPINKFNIQSEEFNFPGHTEYLENAWGGKNLMFMVHENIKVGLVTQHIPLKDVSTTISVDAILHKLTAMRDSLCMDFGITIPKIAVLGLNPHAGDNGLIGGEEERIIVPALKKALAKGFKVFGPYPGDSFFSLSNLKKYDGVLAMYHDQGLSPFKTLAGMEGVNFTAGLPFVRTSPDHGVGYDIADQEIADPASMIEAIYQAHNIFIQRNENLELLDGALKVKSNVRRR